MTVVYTRFPSLGVALRNPYSYQINLSDAYYKQLKTKNKTL
nr:MAG TPA: hypothetical protein [Caudoviricetes sp.]